MLFATKRLKYTPGTSLSSRGDSRHRQEEAVIGQPCAHTWADSIICLHEDKRVWSFKTEPVEDKPALSGSACLGYMLNSTQCQFSSIFSLLANETTASHSHTCARAHTRRVKQQCLDNWKTFKGLYFTGPPTRQVSYDIHFITPDSICRPAAL